MLEYSLILLLYVLYCWSYTDVALLQEDRTNRPHRSVGRLRVEKLFILYGPNLVGITKRPSGRSRSLHLTYAHLARDS